MTMVSELFLVKPPKSNGDIDVLKREVRSRKEGGNRKPKVPTKREETEM
jgi:hypothetical protein